MSVIRIWGPDEKRLIDLADHILQTWRGYTDEAAFVFACTDGEAHNTITPIARRRGKDFELDLVLRNNITTPKHPLGVYHPHAELHHIKKENIGLIEVMGLAVLPARLQKEMHALNEAIRTGKPVHGDAALDKHADWVDDIISRHPQIAQMREEEVSGILKNEIGLVFAKVLEHAGVFKRTQEGRAAFLRFIQAVSETAAV